MDDLAFGLTLRRIRIRRRDRQQDVADRAGISRTTYSRIERGDIGSVRLRSIRRAATALEVRAELQPRWRGGDLDRLLHARHARMSEVVTRRLVGAGWDVVPELSFNHYGERGIVDLVAWHAPRRALLIAELKTELVDVNELLGTMDRRCRIVPGIVRGRGWIPSTVSAWVVLAESRTNRRSVAAHRAVLRAALPEDGRAIAGWLLDPARSQRALWILTDDSPANVRRDLAPIKRVRKSPPSVRRERAS